MQRIHTHYDTLKVSRDAPDEVIRSAYRALARKYHPDSNPEFEEAVKAMQALNHAFEVLIDPIQRKAHDEWIDQQSAETASATNEKTKKTGKFPQGGEFRAKWPQTDKLAPGTVVGIIAVAAALITLVIIALEVQSRSSSKSSPSSDSTPELLALPTPTSTPLVVATPTPALSSEPVDNPNSEVDLIPGIPNAWIIKHSLSPVDSNLPTNDPDKDGFTNIEEFRAGSNPVDGNSRPPAWSKLRLVSTKADKLRIKFVSLPSGDLETVQINTLSTDNPRVLTGASRFYKKGDVIVMSETRSDGLETQTPTPFQLTEVRRVKRFNPTLNSEELMPVITLKNNSDGLELKIAQDEVKESPYTLATLTDTHPSGQTFQVRLAQSFRLGESSEFKLVAVSENGAMIENLATNERHLIPKLTNSTLPTASVTPAAPDAPTFHNPTSSPTSKAEPSPMQAQATPPKSETNDPLSELIYRIRSDMEHSDKSSSMTTNKLQGIWVRDSDFTLFIFDDEGHGSWGKRSRFKVTYKQSKRTFFLDWGPRRAWTNTLRYGTNTDTLEGDTLQGDTYILRRLR